MITILKARYSIDYVRGAGLWPWAAYREGVALRYERGRLIIGRVIVATFRTEAEARAWVESR